MALSARERRILREIEQQLAGSGWQLPTWHTAAPRRVTPAPRPGQLCPPQVRRPTARAVALAVSTAVTVCCAAAAAAICAIGSCASAAAGALWLSAGMAVMVAALLASDSIS
jgi:hypothetical protein